MKFGVVNKPTTLNRFVLHTLQRNITHLAVITRTTNIKFGIFMGGLEKRREFQYGKENGSLKDFHPTLNEKELLSTRYPQKKLKFSIGSSI